jgi:hypothetical protein
MIVTLSILTCIAATGCQQQKTAYSGFLSDYSGLRPNPEVEDALFYQDPSKSLADYNKFILDPVRINLAPGAKGVSVDPAKLKELTDFAREEATAALSKRYQVVNRPGPGILRIRAAITDIELTQPLFNIHPGTKLSGIGLGGASMEAEAIDTVTNKRVFAVVDMREGNRLSIAEGLHEMGHPKQVVQHWVKRFVKRLDKAHGYATE